MRTVTCEKCGTDAETTDKPEDFTGTERWQCPACQAVNIEPGEPQPDTDALALETPVPAATAIVAGDNGESGDGTK